MPLAAGTRLGPYEIVAPFGAGGMGTVYRARDPRLDRQVAIKVLRASTLRDEHRLRRFEREARAVGRLNHPNILTVHDIGTVEDAPYLVSELLEGETLRECLRMRKIPTAKALGYAADIARGLAAAHVRGIVHRDLKPENVFLCRDGRLKILDFGLAKLTEPPTPDEENNTPTQALLSEVGVILGTAGYMSPEQVRGDKVDQRSDLFTLGAIIYEMLSGMRAFRGESSRDTMECILNDDPPALTDPKSEAFEPLLRRCLAKSPDDRFQSASDLAFHLESLAAGSGTSSLSGITRAAKPAHPPLRYFWLAPILIAVAGAFWAVGHFLPPSIAEPAYQRLTFRRGLVISGRFAPDGQTIVYSAAWEGSRSEIFSTRPGNPESRSLGHQNADLLALSSSGEMALALDASHRGSFIRGTLARVALTGSAPRRILEDVLAADWSVDGRELAIVRVVNGKYRLELPIGTLLYETETRIPSARVSPDGRRIAFLEGSSVSVMEFGGTPLVLSKGWATASALAWSAAGDEVWFSASELESLRASASIFAVTLDGRVRTVMRLPVGVTLLDISREHRVLASAGNWIKGIRYHAEQGGDERDLSWFDSSLAADISRDGKTFLFSEGGSGGGSGRSVYIRTTNGSAAVRLGVGTAQALSPDGTQALALKPDGDSTRLVLYPTGAGEPRVLTKAGLSCLGANWFADGKRIVLAARETGRKARTYVLDVDHDALNPITPEGVQGRWVSPDGNWILAAVPGGPHQLYPVSGGASRAIPGLTNDDEPVQWTADGRSIYVRRDFQPSNPDKVPVFLVELATGRRRLWKEFSPTEYARGADVLPIAIAMDGKSYAYTYFRGGSDLYVIDGLK